MNNRDHLLERRLDRVRRYGLICALAAAIVLAAGFLLSPQSAWGGLFTGWLLWLGVSAGCIGIALLHRLTGGAWSISIGRELVAAACVLPLMAVLGLIVLPWHPVFSRTAHTAADSAQQSPSAAADRPENETASDGLHLEWNPHQLRYLNPLSVGLRALAYFVIWAAGGWLAWRRLSELAGQRSGRLSANLSAIGLILFWLAGTFAAVDWLMSLEPYWHSSIFGAAHTMGFAVSGMAVAIIARLWTGDFDDPETIQPTHDLGNLLLAFTMLWVYLAFSQWLIVWWADLPHESAWYLRRIRGPWAFGSVLLIWVHFVIPLALLLSRDLKRNARWLASVAGLVLFARWLDIAWNALPALGGTPAGSILLSFAAALGVGGLWLFAWSLILRRLPLLQALTGQHQPHIAPAEAG